MARQSALLRLQKSVRERRADLCNTLAHQVANLRHVETADATGDSADAAFDFSLQHAARQPAFRGR